MYASVLRVMPEGLCSSPLAFRRQAAAMPLSVRVVAGDSSSRLSLSLPSHPHCPGDPSAVHGYEFLRSKNPWCRLDPSYRCR